MIFKVYELSKLKSGSFNFFLMHGKNEGLQNDIIEKHLKITLTKTVKIHKAGKK